MADLRTDNPETTVQFVKAMADIDVKLPLNISPDEVGVVVDADGHAVFVLDVDNDLPDETVTLRAMWIVLAVNTCGGFKAHRGEPTYG